MGKELWKGASPQLISKSSKNDPNAGGKISFKGEKQGKTVPWKGAGKVGTAVKSDHDTVQCGQKSARNLPLESVKHFGKS